MCVCVKKYTKYIVINYFEKKKWLRFGLIDFFLNTRALFTRTMFCVSIGQHVNSATIARLLNIYSLLLSHLSIFNLLTDISFYIKTYRFPFNHFKPYKRILFFSLVFELVINIYSSIVHFEVRLFDLYMYSYPVQLLIVISMAISFSFIVDMFVVISF